MALGYVTQIIGPVIDCRFPENEIPVINEAIRINHPGGFVTVEVLQQRGDGVVRCVSFDATEGLARGSKAESLGTPVMVPVGEGIAGRMFNTLGQTIDGLGPVTAEEYWPIHRRAPSLPSNILRKPFWKPELRSSIYWFHFAAEEKSDYSEVQESAKRS